MIKLLKGERGITLVEILIVVFIISVILAIAIPNYTQSTANAQDKLCASTRIILEGQFALYEIEQNEKITMKDGKFQLGSNSFDTWEALIEEFSKEGYIKGQATCPAGGVYSIDNNGKLECSIHSYEKNKDEEGD